ncbi:DUF2268 domain-containing protein [Saccharococcus caldoxylosilyticus]|jgi:uncharacterized protein YjaZ|uniref:DUF2268 domain-containing protein n=1 Tax=Parageobacillus caldoxylosilyticus NBRC 107762 TaxID=1220594 RepID=A0A023DID3_9BACL|nr:DUF2268 domain-containing protein [Parageobacillus caldoxylosilyticus]MBB3854177.1 uncharacterized protein YjaZ [Parageobacillus caldoxylosilyticus]BDG42364.1 hypothetical protein PcaKH35_07090 [Parageobacillus caldoxylosilyticus]GAJ41064.1 hypothetical protein GCA01S_057_00030 [Parageobacillus caldoxylosilyticus NBRC 107762]
MAVCRTDRWLEKDGDQPIRLCQRLTRYFPDASAQDIYHYLLPYGMYRPAKTIKEIVEQMKQKDMWKRVEAVYEKRKKDWNGPDVPIFLFPADSYNRKLVREFNGKGGVAFHDKLFLFLLPHHTNKEIEALVTHEYNHVCRLNKQKKKYEKMTLLDAVILEGLAESAVERYVGKDHRASWTSYYSDELLHHFWQRYVAPHRSISTQHPLCSRILYGLGFYPDMVGYAVGYAIVCRCLERGKELAELMDMDSEQMLQIAAFEGGE